MQTKYVVGLDPSTTRFGVACGGERDPRPRSFVWQLPGADEHVFDRASNTILSFICTGKAFETVTLEMCKSTGNIDKREAFFTVTMNQVFITKVNQSATEEGNVAQKVEMVFKHINIVYKQQGAQPNAPGALSEAGTFDWDIPSGEASPSDGG